MSKTNGENLDKRPWISINEQLPEHGHCVEFATHQTFGLGNWDKDKGFTEVFITYGSSEHAEYFQSCGVWNGEIMWWREICNWPYYGKQGYDSELMKKYKHQ